MKSVDALLNINCEKISFKESTNERAKTSFFGNYGRLNHDLAVFYNSKMYEAIKVKNKNNNSVSILQMLAESRIFLYIFT